MDSLPTAPSVSAFFRDPRLQAGAARLSPADAAEMLRHFQQRFGFDLCGADQLLALADLAVRAADEAAAREALQRVAAMPDRAHLANYRLGRIDLSAKRAADAAMRFTEGSRVWPDFPYNWMGLARALLAQGRRAEAADAARRFADFGVRPHARDELAVLAELADMLFDAGERRRAAPIYAVLQAFAPPDPRVAVRHAEALLEAGQAAQALAALLAVQAQVELDAWGRRALAAAQSAAGDGQAALALAEAVLAERPDDAGFAATYLEILVRHGDEAAWHDALARPDGKLRPPARREIEARLALRKGRLADALDVLRAHAPVAHDRLYYLSLETAYAAIADGDVAAAGLIAERLESVGADELPAILLRTDLALHLQRWDDAAAALRRVPAALGDQPQIKLKWFEHACFTGDIARAQSLQAAMEGSGGLPRQAVLPVLRFLAEQQRWDELVTRALSWLGTDFRFHQIGYVLFRAARRSGRYAELLAAIEALPGWAGHADLARLHTALAWDRAGTVSAMDQVSRQAEPSLAMRHRMEVQRRVMARATSPYGRRALFLCTDAAYLSSTIVALHSALEHGAPSGEDVFVIVPDALAAQVERLVAPFRTGGAQVSVVPASTIVPAHDKLDPSYGLFTSGHVLAAAAYYRIYFARHLWRLGGYGRALYLDSDVLARRPLDTLFDADLDGQPLAARVEQPRPEVARAIALHRLEADLYFNSGVLLFDLTHPRLCDALDQAIAAVSDDSVTLLFHDQCALNLGFRDLFRRLPLAWNFPVTERMSLSDLPAEAAILHYLDRPKPWSAAYDGPCATLWFDQWARTADVIGAEAAVALLETAGD